MELWQVSNKRYKFCHKHSFKLRYANYKKNSLSFHFVNAVFAGWGKTKTSDTKASEHLQIIETNIVSLKECLRTSMGFHVQEHHICAFAKRGVGACDGDSGGPLVSDDKLVGVANFVRPCALGVPDVFSSTAHYYDWIMEKIARK